MFPEALKLPSEKTYWDKSLCGDGEMKMDIGEVFCELLSGLAIMFLALPLLDLFKISSLSQSLMFVGRHYGAAELAGALVLAYSLGLIMDAFGLAIGERWLYGLLEEAPPEENESSPTEYDTLPEERNAFYAKVLPHVLEHREYEYAYLLAYTNLIIVAVPAGGLWCAWAFIRCGWQWSLFMAFVFIILVWALKDSIKFYLNQDAEITRAYTSEDAKELPGD